MIGGMWARSSFMYYPKIYNIEMDPHEDLQLPNYMWAAEPAFKVIMEYEASVRNIRTRLPGT